MDVSGKGRLSSASPSIASRSLDEITRRSPRSERDFLTNAGNAYLRYDAAQRCKVRREGWRLATVVDEFGQKQRTSCREKESATMAPSEGGVQMQASGNANEEMIRYRETGVDVRFLGPKLNKIVEQKVN